MSRRLPRAPALLAALLVALLVPAGVGRAQEDAPLPPALRLFSRMVRGEATHELRGRVVEELRFPEAWRAEAAESFRHPRTVAPALVIRNYEMAVAGRDEVAGRPAQVLQLVPDNGVSPSWRFWLDVDTGLRLAYEQRDADGELLASGRYVAVEGVRERMQPQPPAPAEAPPELRRRVLRLLGEEGLPDGFVPAGLEPTRLGGQDGVAALRLTLWDGLNSVVLFVYPRQSSLPERPYLASRNLRSLSVSVLGPLPRPVLDGWLEGLGRGPLRRMTPREVGRLEPPERR